MENSAYEALIIGTNVLLFVLALTISINLMMNVREMSENANEVISSENGSLVEIEGDGTPEAGIPGISDELNTERIYSGREVLSYYMDSYTNNKYDIELDLISDPAPHVLDDVIYNKNRRVISNMRFILEYRGVSVIDGRIIFRFVQI